MKFTPIEEARPKLKFIPVKEESSLTKTLSTSQKQQPTGDPVTDALIFTQKEVVGPIARGADTALLGIPKAVTKKVAGEEFAKQAFPEQSTLLGKTLRFGSEVAGIAEGGVGKASTAVMKKLAPAGSSLGKKILAGAAAGAAGGALTPQDDFTDIGKRTEAAAGGAVVGGSLPVVGAGLSKIPDAAGAIGRNIYNNLVRLPTKAFRFGKDPLETFAKEKIVANSTEEFVQKSKDLLKQRTSELNQAVASSDKKINVLKPLLTHMRTAAKDASMSLKDRTAIVKELQVLRKRLAKFGDLRNLSIQKAVQLKRQLADDFPFISEDPNNINTKMAHKAYHDINELVEQAVPQIKDLNQRVSGLIDISNAAVNRAAVESRNNPLSLIDTIMGTGTAIATGNPLFGAGLVLAKHALSSPATQTRVANALINLSKVEMRQLLLKNPWLAAYPNIKQKADDVLGTKFTSSLGKTGELYAEPGVVSRPTTNQPIKRIGYTPKYLQERENIPKIFETPPPAGPVNVSSGQPKLTYTPKYLQEREQIPKIVNPQGEAIVLRKEPVTPEVINLGTKQPNVLASQESKGSLKSIKNAQEASIVRSGKFGNKGSVYIGDGGVKYRSSGKTGMEYYDSMLDEGNVSTGEGLMTKKEYFEKFKKLTFDVKEVSPDKYIDDATKALWSSLSERSRIDYGSFENFKELALKSRSKEKISDLVNKIKSGKELDLPVVETSITKGGTQEGLHRAMAAKQLGIQKIPVLYAFRALGSLGPQMAMGAGTGAALWGKDAKAAEQTLGQKNNNPINIKAFEDWEGLIGKDKQGHAQFKDLDHGIRAGLKNLKTRQKRQPNQTLREYMNEFAEENGDNEAEYVAKKMKISADTKLKDINMDFALIHIAKFESKTDLTPKDISRVKMKFKLK